MTTLDIVIVNWNSGLYLSRALRSMNHARTTGVNISVIIVDNHSSDQSLEIAKQHAVEARIVVNTANVGFAAACNQGAALGHGEFVLFMNPDVELTAHSLLGPLEFMNRDNGQFGICGIRLLDANGRPTASCARFPTAVTLIARCFALDRIAPSHFPPHFLTEAELMSSRAVDQVIGAFFLIRRKVFDVLGGFDERFFMYFEELDLSYRAVRLSYQSYYLSDSYAIHHGGRSSNAVVTRRLMYSWDSRIKYAFKHFSTMEGYCVLLATLLVEPLVRLVYYIASLSLRDAVATLAAAAITWSRLGTVLTYGSLRYRRGA